MMTSCGTGSIKTTPFRFVPATGHEHDQHYGRFQYSVGRAQCPACHKQKSLIVEETRVGTTAWAYCFHCKAKGPLRYLQTGDTSQMKEQLVLRGFMGMASREFLLTSGDGYVRGILGIPFRSDDPLRRFYDAFMGYAPMRIIQLMVEQLHLRPALEGGSRSFWTESGLVIAIQDWPGRITGFLCLAPSGPRTIWLYPGVKTGICFLRLRPTERIEHFGSLRESCERGTIYGSLDIDINLTCDPVL
jgi:hypothetical protein